MRVNEEKEQRPTKPNQEVGSHKLMKQLIAVAVSTPLGDPRKPGCVMGLHFNIEGPKGIGKTTLIRAVAERLGLASAVIPTATLTPDDLGTLTPLAGPEVPILGAFRRMLEAKRGVLVFDDMTAALRQVQNGMLSIALDRHVGAIPLGGGIRTMSLTNPQGAGSAMFEMNDALANRMAQFSIQGPTHLERVEFYNEEGMPRSASVLDFEEIVQTKWDRVWPKAVELFLGFSKRHSALIDAPVPEGCEGQPWATTRSFDLAARAAATCWALDKPELEPYFMGALCGEVFAKEFQTYRHDQQLPDPEDVLKGGWQHDPRRLDLTYGVVSCVARHVKMCEDAKEREERGIKFLEVLGQIVKTAPDVVVSPFRIMSRIGLSTRSASARVRAAVQPVAQELGDRKLASYIERDASEDMWSF